MQGRLARLTDSLTPAEGGAPEEQSAGASKREQLHGDSLGTDLSSHVCCDRWTWLMRRVSVCAAPIYLLPGAIKQHMGLPSHPQKLKLSSKLRAIRIAAVGGRIKYLVDTPETLWGCLDAGSFQAAAHRFLRASLVYEALQGGDAASAMRQFPLVRTQWPLVAKFRSATAGIRDFTAPAFVMLNLPSTGGTIVTEPSQGGQYRLPEGSGRNCFIRSWRSGHP